MSPSSQITQRDAFVLKGQTEKIRFKKILPWRENVDTLHGLHFVFLNSIVFINMSYIMRDVLLYGSSNQTSV